MSRESELIEECRRRGGTVGPSAAESVSARVRERLTKFADDLESVGGSVERLPEKGYRVTKVKKPRRKRTKQPKQTDLAVKLFQSICEREGLPVPKPEYYFARPERQWRVDWYFEWPRGHRDQGWGVPVWSPAIRLALEIEGKIWKQGRHTRGSGFMKDMEKYNRLSVMGIHLLRVTPEQFRDGTALQLVREFAEKHGLR